MTDMWGVEGGRTGVGGIPGLKSETWGTHTWWVVEMWATAVIYHGGAVFFIWNPAPGWNG